MAMFLRSSIGVALWRTGPASRLFSSVARHIPGCTAAGSALLRRPSLLSSSFFPGCMDATRRMMSSYGMGGNGAGKSSKAFWNQDRRWKRSDILFFGITAVAGSVVHSNIRAAQERKWQRQIRDTEIQTCMLDKEKADETDISFR